MVEIAKTGDIIEWMGNGHIAPGVVVETVEVESPFPACRREFRIQWINLNWIRHLPYDNRTIMRLYCRGDELW